MSSKNDHDEMASAKPEASTETEHVEVAEPPIEPIRTISRVPGNPNYHEKNGLRTEGDGVDHTHYNSVSFCRLNLSLYTRCLTMTRAPLDLS